MAWDPTPWFVGNGAEHSPEIARLLAFASTGGAEGIVTPGDLRVTALPVPDKHVRVNPGAALLLNRSPNGAQQTYVGRNVTVDDVEINPTTSSGGRTDLIIARVEDPQFPGWAEPDDPTTGQYIFTRVIEGVGSGIRSARELNLPYPAIALAKVTLPPSTATVTNAMITDLRRLATPRETRDFWVQGVQSRSDGPGSTWGNYPNDAYDTDVPEWATQAQISVELTGVQQRGLLNGSLRVMFGYGTGGATNFDFNDATTGTDVAVQTLKAYHRIANLSEFQGTRQTVRLQAVKAGGTGFLRVDAGISQISWDIQYYERAI